MISYSKRLYDLAAESPNEPAVTCGDESITRGELQSRANRLARDFADRGVIEGSFVTVALGNSIEWVVTYVAIWKLGAVPQPVSARLPGRELAEIVGLAEPALVVGADDGVVDGVPTIPVGYRPSADLDDAPLPDVVSPAWKAPTSGGSTGRPKLIVSTEPALFDPDAPNLIGFQPGGGLVMPGPLYHNGPAVWACGALLAGNHVVLLPKFDAEQTLSAVEAHQADILYVVPTMMKRIVRLPDDVRLGYDLSSLRLVWHLAEPCPEWLKQAWIDWLGPQRIIELYAGTEAQAVTVIVGTEWLDHRGSVGRVVAGEMVVLDEAGNEVPTGHQGEVWMRTTNANPTYRYVGAEAKAREGGWESLGDVGWFDEDGYLYLGDRLSDMILCGGANVYPAEVESVLLEHPAVRSAAVIGLPDDDRGSIVHGIVEADRSEVSPDDVLTFARERLALYKLPRSIDFVDQPLRDDAGKIRRSALRAERLRPGG